MTRRPGWASRAITEEPRRRGLRAVPPWLPDRDPAQPELVCQLCQLELDDLEGPLCQLCRAVLDGDPQAWVESGGRTCRRCHLEVPACSAVDGLCPCGGALL